MDRGLYQRTIKNLATGRSGRLSIAAALAFFITTAPAFGQAILEGERFHPVTATQGMVATSHTLATEVALEVLKNGGNAIDAAVTAGFALAVTQPRSGNIGGGGFMLISRGDGSEELYILGGERGRGRRRRKEIFHHVPLPSGFCFWGGNERGLRPFYYHNLSLSSASTI